MNEEEHEFTDYGMVMPFVTVTSKGGPHDDDSYVAGWEMGALDAELKVSTWPLTRTVRTENLPQVDLIAMRYGYTTDWYTAETAPEWSVVLLSPPGKGAR